MPRLGLDGDVVFSLDEDGRVHAESTTGVRAAVSLEELAALHVARASWNIGGESDDAMLGKLARWGLQQEGPALLRSLQGKRLLGERGAPDRDARRGAPIFMVFSPRSGSNMLRWLLEAHPRLTCPTPSPLLHLLLDAVNHTWSASAYRALRAPKPWTRRILRRWFESQMEAVAEKQGRARWCFRHWVSYRNLFGIDELFDARPLYVYLVRHALDVVDAACKVYVPAETWQAGPNGAAVNHFVDAGGSYHLAYARFWREVNERMLEFRAAHPSRVHVLTYEQLCERPDDVLGGLFDFLGEEAPAGLARRAFEAPPRMLPAWEGHEVTRTRRIEKDRMGLWRRWEPDLIRAAAPIVNPGLQAWGYPTV